jgi:formyl-CoA transferase
VALSIDRFDAERRAQMLEAIAAIREQGLGYPATLEFRTGLGLQRSTAHYYRVYQAKDGMVAVACLNNRQRRALRDEIGIDDPAVEGGVFQGREATAEEHVALMERFEATFLEKTVEEWTSRLNEIDVPTVPVRLTEEIFDDPQAAALGIFESYEHPSLGRITQARSPVEYDGHPMSIPGPPPSLGANTDAILHELGYDAKRIESLRAGGVLRLGPGTM